MASKALGGLLNLNGHLLCAVDCETSGDTPDFHDILQICILPLDADIKPWKLFIPFNLELKPKRPENYGLAAQYSNEQMKKKNRELMSHAQINGLDPYHAAELFEEWFENLKLLPGKRIVPLGHNWPADRDFIISWLGRKTFNYIFDARYRDSMVALSFQNDWAEMHSYPLVHNGILELGYVASQFNIDHVKAHEAMNDCLTTAELYRQLALLQVIGRQ